MGRTKRIGMALNGWVIVGALLLGIITVQAYIAIDNQARLAARQ